MLESAFDRVKGLYNVKLFFKSKLSGKIQL